MEAEAEVFGKRTVSGFLAQVGAEEAMSADQVIWSEQGRLHLSYKADVVSAAGGTIILLTILMALQEQLTTVLELVIQVLISGGGQTITAYVSVAAAANARITVLPYSSATLANAGFVDGDNDIKILVFGSEYAKGTNSIQKELISLDFTTFTNKPIILKDYYEVSGSDASQIGWVEVSGEDGQNGYLWYLKAEGDTRARFSDYCEMACY